jgi:hypothetical protein
MSNASKARRAARRAALQASWSAEGHKGSLADYERRQAALARQESTAFHDAALGRAEAMLEEWHGAQHDY